MNHEQYYNSKAEYAYFLEKERKYFRKARAIIIKDNKVLAIKNIPINKSQPAFYTFAGGGVEDDETIIQAVKRESMEEYGASVTPIKFIGKQYYSITMRLNDKTFKSHRVEYFYICKFEKYIRKDNFGVEGEFDFDDRTFEKVELSLSEIKQLNCKALGKLNQKMFNTLISFLENNKIKNAKIY